MKIGRFDRNSPLKPYRKFPVVPGGGRYLIYIFPRWPPLPKVTFVTFEPKGVETFLVYQVPLILG